MKKSQALKLIGRVSYLIYYSKTVAGIASYIDCLSNEWEDLDYKTEKKTGKQLIKENE